MCLTYKDVEILYFLFQNSVKIFYFYLTETCVLLLSCSEMFNFSF